MCITPPASCSSMSSFPSLVCICSITSSLAPSLPYSFISTLLPQLRKELDAVDPLFFEEVEDLKYNYQEAIKQNVQYEEQISRLSQQLGVAPPTFNT